jgi:hypothetical protein
MTGDCMRSIEDSELLDDLSGILIPSIYTVCTLLAGKFFMKRIFL